MLLDNNSFATLILQQKMAIWHDFGGQKMSFSHGRLGSLNAPYSTFLRVAADLIETGVEIDTHEAREHQVLYWSDDNDRVVSFLIVSCEGNTFTVMGGWTSPTFRRLGLFKALMQTFISVAMARKMAPEVKSAPPVSNPFYDSALEQLGFKPVSLVTQYAPF